MKQWKSLCTVNNKMEAEILKSSLESRGFRVILKGEAVGEIYGLTSGPLAQVEILVASEQYEEAEKFLEEYPEDDA